MNIFSGKIKEASEGISKVLDSVSNLADNNFTSKEEKATIVANAEQAKNKLRELEMNAVTQRHANDMKSDNKLSKNIRPLTLLLMLLMLIGVVTLYAIWDIEVPHDYVEIIKEWGKTALMFYFGGRTLEKADVAVNAITNIFKRRKKNG